MIPAVQYLRVSSERQQYSLENQAATIREYANHNALAIVHTYSDTGRSGLRLGNRPALKRLLTDIIEGDAAFKAVLVYDVSRWGRFQDSDEAAHYEFLCKASGVEVHYCAECFVNNNSMPSSVMKALKRTMAAEYSRDLGEKTFAGSKRIAELGFKQGGKPGFGLRRMMVSADGEQGKMLSTGEVKGVRTDRVILVPGPTWEVECIREMYRLLVEENRTPYYITRKLNQEGIPSASGTKWRLMAVLQILTHPKYIGTNVWNRSSSRLGTRRRSRPEASWVVTPGAFQSIIRPEQFSKAQRILAEQRAPYSEEEVLASLRSLLRKHGALTCNIVRASKAVSLDTIARRFGSVRKAFHLAGYEPRYRTRRDESAANKLR